MNFRNVTPLQWIGINFTTVQARVGTAQGSAATADVCVNYLASL